MMNSQKNNLVKKYLHRIRKNLYVHGSTKKEFLKDIEADLISYIEEQETVTYDMLVDAFGTPEEIAADYIRELDSSILGRQISGKKCVFIACLVCALAVLSVGGIKAYLDYRAHVNCMDARIAIEKIVTEYYYTGENAYEEN